MTSLVGGVRVKKNSVRLEAYGTIDELSSAVGVVLSSPDCLSEVKGQLLQVQDILFNIGSYLATDVKEGEEPKAGLLKPEDLTDLEGWIDALDEQTPRVKAFVLPGGCPEAANAHIARVVCRRAERRIIDLSDEAYVDPAVIKYVNRLSDYLFILARYFNFMGGVEEITWRKNKTK